jgi:flagellar biosynthesis protein FlhG
VANTAIALAQTGKRVLVLDADLGLGNIDILLGLTPKYTLEHVLAKSCRLEDIALTGPNGIVVLPASTGISQLTTLTEAQQVILQEELERLASTMDVLLIDTGAGISSTVTYFAAAAQSIVIVVSPEPTSLTDAYALMKVLLRQYRERRFYVLVNMVKSPRDAARVYRKLAVTQQRAVLDLYPNAPASRAFRELTDAVGQLTPPALPKGTVQFLWQQLLRTH